MEKFALRFKTEADAMKDFATAKTVLKLLKTVKVDNEERAEMNIGSGHICIGIYHNDTKAKKRFMVFMEIQIPLRIDDKQRVLKYAEMVINKLRDINVTYPAYDETLETKNYNWGEYGVDSFPLQPLEIDILDAEGRIKSAQRYRRISYDDIYSKM